MRTAAGARQSAAAMTALVLVLAGAVCLTHQLASAQSNPGPKFPFYDSCRPNAKYSRWSLRLLTPSVDVTDPVPATRYCFLLRVNETATCPEEVFRLRGKTVVSRCCNTAFAKIKFYIDARCKGQYQASPLTVPGNTTLGKNVSPTFDSRPSNYTEVKYTRFGPIPQNVLNGTTFCLTLKKDGPCNLTNLTDITSPFNRGKGIFQAALYDRKVDDYECCPTFTFNT